MALALVCANALSMTALPKSEVAQPEPFTVGKSVIPTPCSAPADPCFEIQQLDINEDPIKVGTTLTVTYKAVALKDCKPTHIKGTASFSVLKFPFEQDVPADL